MLRCLKNPWCSPAVCFGWLACLLTAQPLVGQALPAPIQPAQFDPSDVYFQGYLASRAAEQLETSGDFIGASEKLQQAQKLFETIRLYHPEWKPGMVGNRATKNAESVTRLQTKADEQRQNKRNVVAELEGGVKKSGTLEPAPNPALPPTANILEVNPLETRRLEQAEAEVKRLRQEAAKPPAEDPEQSRNESRIRDLGRQRDAAQSELKAAENTLQSLRNRLAAAPVESEMKALNQRIAGLEQERNAMALALQQSRSSQLEAQARMATLQADLAVMQQKYTDLNRDLKAERSVANSVVAGQRTQLQALEKQLTQKNEELNQAQQTIGGLMKELAESRDAFSQLRSDRDTLLQERDQMSALLKLNEASRIQDLVTQNMGLAKNLREANEKVTRLNVENNASKDDITDALRDLAMAKSQINKLHQEKREQDTRLEALETRLKTEETALNKGETTADPAEVEVLRDIIQRQLRVQERRRQARDLLVDAVKEMGQKDQKIAEAVQLFDGQEVQLTPDEQRLLADKNVDGEFVSPFAQDRSVVGKNTDELNKDVTVFERTAEKAFVAGRLLPARELLQMVVDDNPGRISALCKLGVIHMRLNDMGAAVNSFRRAGEMDTGNAYAHRMLGFALMTAGDIDAAEKSVKVAVDLAADDAKNQILYATICFRLGRSSEAESHYKAAILADPLPSEPYFNLALLCARNQRLEAGNAFYQQALERGAIPDTALEQRLSFP
jgi:tetratricopeptide (TPR) repeat protein